MNDEFNFGEMDSADSLDEDWISDEEPTSQFEIESNDHGVSYSGRQVLIQSQRGTIFSGRGVRTHGGLAERYPNNTWFKDRWQNYTWSFRERR